MFHHSLPSIAFALAATAVTAPTRISAQGPDPEPRPPATASIRPGTTLWVDAFGGGGVTGLAGGFGATLGFGPVAVIGRYGKTQSSGSSVERYREYYGGLIGYRGLTNGNAFTLAAGLGTARMWEERLSECGGGWFGGGTCKVAGDAAGPAMAGLLESSWYPAPNGGVFAWGFRLTGALSEPVSTASAAIVLGVGKTP